MHSLIDWENEHPLIWWSRVLRFPGSWIAVVDSYAAAPASTLRVIVDKCSRYMDVPNKASITMPTELATAIQLDGVSSIDRQDCCLRISEDLCDKRCKVSILRFR